jgi:hypothetical protein
VGFDGTTNRRTQEQIVRYLRLLLIVAALSLPTFASDSPFSGTWKLKPKEGEAISSTARVQADNEHLKLEQDFMDDKGKSSTVRFDAKFDGKDYSSSGDDGFDSVSLHRINEREFTLTFKKAGKVVGRNHVSVSRDGRTTTVSEIFNNEAKPREEKHVDVYEKQ